MEVVLSSSVIAWTIKIREVCFAVDDPSLEHA